jgi:hypothetical protein
VKWPARETLCQGRVIGGWCVLVDGHDGKCTRYPTMPIVDFADAGNALDRHYPKAGR